MSSNPRRLNINPPRLPTNPGRLPRKPRKLSVTMEIIGNTKDTPKHPRNIIQKQEDLFLFMFNSLFPASHAPHPPLVLHIVSN